MRCLSVIKYIPLLIISVFLVSCEKDDNEHHFSAMQERTYCEAISRTYDANAIIASLDMKSGMVFKDTINTKIHISNGEDKSITFYGIPLAGLANVVADDSQLHEIFSQLGNCDISFNYDLSEGADETVSMTLDGDKRMYSFITKEHNVKMTMESNTMLSFPLTADMDAVRKTLKEHTFNLDVYNLTIDNQANDNYRILILTKINLYNYEKAIIIYPAIDAVIGVHVMYQRGRFPARRNAPYNH
jgi:hypothetical protein